MKRFSFLCILIFITISKSQKSSVEDLEMKEKLKRFRMLFSAAKKSSSDTTTFSKEKNTIVKNMRPSYLPGVKKSSLHFPKPTISISKMKKTMIDWYCKRSVFNSEIPCMMNSIVKSAKTSSDDIILNSIEMLSAKINTKSLRDSYSKMFQLFCKISPDTQIYRKEICENVVLKDIYKTSTYKLPSLSANKVTAPDKENYLLRE